MKDPNIGDGRAWIMSSLDLRNSGNLMLTLRFDKSIMTESGVLLRVDDRPVGVLSFFECGMEFCKSAATLANGKNVNEFGTLLQTGKLLTVDFKVAANAGYRLALNLNGLSGGIAALYATARQPSLPTDQIVEASPPPTNSVIGPDGVMVAEASEFKIEAFKSALDTTIGASSSMISNSGSDGYFTDGCTTKTGARSNYDMGEKIVVGGDFSVSSDYQHRVKDFIKRTRECNEPQVFVITHKPEGNEKHPSNQGPSAKAFEFLQGMSVKQVITEEGVPSDRVFLKDGGKINFIADLAVSPSGLGLSKR